MLRQNFITLLAYIDEPYSSRSKLLRLVWATIRDEPADEAGCGMAVFAIILTPGGTPVPHPPRRMPTGIGRGDAYIYDDLWSASRKRGGRLSLPASALLPW